MKIVSSTGTPPTPFGRSIRDTSSHASKEAGFRDFLDPQKLPGPQKACRMCAAIKKYNMRRDNARNAAIYVRAG